MTNGKLIEVTVNPQPGRPFTFEVEIEEGMTMNEILSKINRKADDEMAMWRFDKVQEYKNATYEWNANIKMVGVKEADDK